MYGVRAIKNLIFRKKPTRFERFKASAGKTYSKAKESAGKKYESTKKRVEGMSTGKKIGLGVILGLGGQAVTGLSIRGKNTIGPTRQHGAANVGAHFYNTAPRSRKV